MAKAKLKKDAALHLRIVQLEAENEGLERRVAELEGKLEGSKMSFAQYAVEKVTLREERDRLWRQMQAINLISGI